jgi:hypothetical protein
MQSPATPSKLESIDEPDFRASGELEEGRLTMRLAGQADPRSNAHIDGFLLAADDRSVAAGVKEVIVDFRQLEFMNSSCLKSLVTWLRRVQQRSPEHRYAIRFLHAPDSPWQERSFSALAAFGRGFLTIE